MTAVRTWWASRLAVALLVLAGSVQVTGEHASDWLDRWDSWDASLFVKVARFGYDGYPGSYPDRDIAAFFPGFPLVLRAVHLLVPSWQAAGLLVSLVAGAVAVSALARLAALEGADGSRAALYLVLSPYAVFLFAGYSEALFLALALPGWLAARSGRWPAAGVLVGAACLVRVSGAFLAVALLVQWAVTSRRVRELPWLAVPFATLFAFAAYLHSLSGDWLRWQHAQERGWGRQLTSPWQALQTTLDLGRVATAPEYAWSYRAEVVAVAVGVLVTLLLLRRRQWGEATYVGLSVGALATSTYYLSVGRATLLWFPLWVVLAQAAGRWRWVHLTYVVLATPLMAAAVLTFTAGRWVG